MTPLPTAPVRVHVEVDGRTFTTNPLPADRAAAMWNEQHALGRRVRIEPWGWGERPPWVLDGRLWSLDCGRVVRGQAE